MYIKEFLITGSFLFIYISIYKKFTIAEPIATFVYHVMFYKDVQITKTNAAFVELTMLFYKDVQITKPNASFVKLTMLFYTDVQIAKPNALFIKFIMHVVL